jgi:hypothetical protein
LTFPWNICYHIFAVGATLAGAGEMKMDTNLIEKFAALFDEIEAFRPTFESAVQRRDAELTRRTGIPSYWSLRTDDEVKRVRAAQTVIDDEIGFDALNEKMEALWERLDPVVKTITSAPARDLTDLALKANATATAWGSLWEQTPDELGAVLN